jgi:hypothetical protein
MGPISAQTQLLTTSKMHFNRRHLKKEAQRLVGNGSMLASIFF